MNTRDAAELLGITPKALRRFLRTHEDWSGVGISGTYDLSDADIRKLRRQLNAPTTFGSDGYDWLNADRGVTVEVMSAAKNDPKLKGALKARRRARRQRLGHQLLELAIIDQRTYEGSWR